MRIDSIEIENFRQYKHLELQFPHAGGNDLHIICADNGVGKTNLLNAVTWCLYGDEPHLGSSSKSLPRVNLEAKKEAAEKGDETVNISVKITAKDGQETLRFEREQTFIIEKNFEKMPVFRVVYCPAGADWSIAENDDARAIVEKYVPEKIRQYFYFDGEQLDSYFISDDSSKIKETIHAISQVDVVTRVKDRLAGLIKKKESEAGKKHPKVQEINGKLDILTENREKTEKEIKELNKNIAISEQKIKECEDKLKGQELKLRRC